MSAKQRFDFRVMVSMTNAMGDILRTMASEENITLAEMIRKILAEAIKKGEAK